MSTITLAASPVPGKAAITAAALRFGSRPLSCAALIGSLRLQHSHGSSPRQHRPFTSSAAAYMKVKQYFPPPEPSRIKYAGPAWEHPM